MTDVYKPGAHRASKHLVAPILKKLTPPQLQRTLADLNKVKVRARVVRVSCACRARRARARAWQTTDAFFTPPITSEVVIKSYVRGQITNSYAHENNNPPPPPPPTNDIMDA